MLIKEKILKVSRLLSQTGGSSIKLNPKMSPPEVIININLESVELKNGDVVIQKKV